MALTIGNRTLAYRGTRTGSGKESLTAVRDYLQLVEQKQQPIDTQVAMNDIAVDFCNKKMTATVGSTQYRFSTNGAGQLAGKILPARFFTGLKELAVRSDNGGDLATQVWEEFVHDQDTVRMVRTINMGLPEGTRRVVRSCPSTKYVPYSNLFFVQLMLDHVANNYTQFPVVDWILTDNGFRLRFVEGDLSSGEPLPMIEAWNSETGNRRVGVRGGVFHSGKSVTLTHWDNSKEKSWIHRGEAKRIRREIGPAFDDVFNTAHGVVASYKSASLVAVETPYQFLEKQLSGQLSDKAIKAIQEALTLELDGNATLEDCVDAVNLSGEGKDIYDQAEIEKVSANVLKKGLAIASTNNGKVA